MSDYKNIYCNKGDYFSCPETLSTAKEKDEEKGVAYEGIRLDESHYKKSAVTKITRKFYERKP